MRQRSGGAWQNLNGWATEPQYLAYNMAIAARETAMKRFKENKAKAAATRQMQLVAKQVPVGQKAFEQMKAAKWATDYARSNAMKKASLVALARTHAQLADQANLSGTGHNKKALVALLEPFFKTQRAALPRPKRSNAGVAAARLGAGEI